MNEPFCLFFFFTFSFTSLQFYFYVSRNQINNQVKHVLPVLDVKLVIFPCFHSKPDGTHLSGCFDTKGANFNLSEKPNIVQELKGLQQKVLKKGTTTYDGGVLGPPVRK